MGLKKIGIALLLVLGLLSVQACNRYLPKENSCNFVMNSAGQRVSWKDGSLIYLYIHSSVPQAYEAAIQDAVAEWNDKLEKTQIQVLTGISAGTQPQKDGSSVIYLLNDWEAEKRMEQARTTVYWSGTHIYEADIRLNEKDFNFFLTEESVPNKVHLKSLVLHEIGHVLGLSHSESSGSVMAESLLNGQLRDEVKDADIQSLRCEYD